MTDKLIETRIRQHYVAEDGEWLVRKGKVKEAKMLKEACETIVGLRKSYKTAENAYYNKLSDFSKRERVVADREKDVAENEERLRSHIGLAAYGLEIMLGSLEKTND